MGIAQFLNETVLHSITYLGNPLILAVIALAAFGFSHSFLIAVIGLAIVEATCIFIKLLYFKQRPRRQKFTNIIERLDASSFPSVHAARSSFLYLYLAWFAAIPAKIAFIAVILAVSMSRILLKKHYIIDVLAGYGIGILLLLACISLK
ncbi:MAG: phosphatase PAP2 family protein [Candidatus Woesearchaeota archaeon]